MATTKYEGELTPSQKALRKWQQELLGKRFKELLRDKLTEKK